MNVLDYAQLFLFTGVFIILTPVLGTYIARVFSGQRTFLHPLFSWLEKLCYQIGGVHPDIEMTWIQYGKALLFFNIIGFIFLFCLLLLQGHLPMNPQNLPGTSWDLSFNTTSSFVTNTNWQSYSGETTLSYLSQMVGLTVQNFLSAATGMTTFLVLTRGIIRKNTELLGNYWVDMVRMCVYILLPLSFILALNLINEGVIQTVSPYAEVSTLEEHKQMIPLGPVASQVAIKQIGSNGGGFFNANSAHPFENPTSLTNFLETLAIVLIPAATVYAYGILINSKKHAWLLFCAMLTLWGGGIALSLYSENLFNPILEAFPLMEGKETRFETTNSILWSTSTTSTSNGSINAMLSSLSPLAGGVALFNILLGELIFGGVGVGLCSILMFALLTVFLSGLMVGRTPEYLGKKIEKQEIKWVTVAILLPGALILIGTGFSCINQTALSSISHQGPHGLTELLYAFSSCAGNNGSAFAGLNANMPYYNIILGTVMLLGRLSIILPSLAIAGVLVRKNVSPPSIGTFSTNSLLFFILVLAVILIVSALTFFPVLALGPIVEHLLMLDRQSF